MNTLSKVGIDCVTLLAEIRWFAVAKKQRKDTERHISISQLPEEERFQRLATPRKHLVDTIK